MLEPHAHGQAFHLERATRGVQVAVNVARGMPRGQYHRTPVFAAVACRNAKHATFGIGYQTVGARLEMHLAATGQYGVAHVLDNARQAVGADMRMCVAQYPAVRAVLAEYAENAAHVAAFLAVGVELAVGISPRASLAERIIAFGVYFLLLWYEGNVALTVAHVLSPLEHHGFQSQLDEPQRREQPSRPGTNNDHMRRAVHRPVVYRFVIRPGRLLVNVHAHRHAHNGVALPRVNALFIDTQGRYRAAVD